MHPSQAYTFRIVHTQIKDRRHPSLAEANRLSAAHSPGLLATGSKGRLGPPAQEASAMKINLDHSASAADCLRPDDDSAQKGGRRNRPSASMSSPAPAARSSKERRAPNSDQLLAQRGDLLPGAADRGAQRLAVLQLDIDRGYHLQRNAAQLDQPLVQLRKATG